MIEILLATYNGEKYITEQINSILSQTQKEWQLIIRDDCSTDRTVEIVSEYVQKYPSKIKLIQAKQPSGSAQNNFFQLIKQSTAEYIMFSDQDDVWLEDKIEKTLKKMQELENSINQDNTPKATDNQIFSGTKSQEKEIQAEQQNSAPASAMKATHIESCIAPPLLIHSDVKVVDEKLNLINPSFFNMHNMDYRRDKLNNILVQNIVTGCTVMVNRSLLDFIDEIPEKAVMHDMWLALIASAFGKIGFINEPTMLYRQHSSNVKGARDMRSLSYTLHKILSPKEIHKCLVEQYRQAEEFQRIYKNKLREDQQNMLSSYADFEEKTVFQKFIEIQKYNLKKKGFIRAMGQILC